MPNQQGEDLVGINEGGVAVDGSDAVAVAIGTEGCIVFSGAHGLTGGLDVRLDGLGVNAGEARVACAANLIAGYAIASEKLTEQTRRGAVHWIAHKAEFRI